MPKISYSSDIQLGEKYIDDQTGFVGIATAVSFFQYACERISLETYDAERREVKHEVFDAPRLRSVVTNEVAKVTKTGGPQLPVGQRNPASR